MTEQKNQESLGEAAPDRRVIALTGADARAFLKGLTTNDVKAPGAGLSYGALLTPQGKYLVDFLMWDDGTAIHLDVHESLAEALMRRLSMYRLRAAVEIAPTALKVRRGLGPLPEGAMADPRHPALGWRAYGHEEGTAPLIDWNAIRVANVIPESGIELIPDESYILEMGFERLGGVDFRKGCYVGQEVTARMKHKTELRKGLVALGMDGAAEPGTAVEADGKPAGTLHTVAGDRALAYLRLDRAEGAQALTAGAVRLVL